MLSGSIRRKPQNDNLHRISNRCHDCRSVRYVVLEMTKETFTWTDEIINRAAQLWASGMDATQIGLEIGVNRNKMLGIMHRNREKFPKRGELWPRSAIDKAAELWDQGVSVSMIGLALGYTKGQISGMIKRNRERFPVKKTGRKRADDKKTLSVDRIAAKKSPRNDPVNRMSKFNPNAGSKEAKYEDPQLDSFEMSRLPGVSLVDNDGCMYPLTAEGPHLFCGHLRFKGRYCEHHTYKCEGYKGISISYKKAYDRNIMEVV